MRLKWLTNFNTLLLVTVCIALGATLWWSQRALERPYQLMERYLGLSQQFQNQAARNIQDYLGSGDALRHAAAMAANQQLQAALADWPSDLADKLRPSLGNLQAFTADELLAAGKLAGDPQALLLQAERELGRTLNNWPATPATAAAPTPTATWCRCSTPPCTSAACRWPATSWLAVAARSWLPKWNASCS